MTDPTEQRQEHCKSELQSAQSAEQRECLFCGKPANHKCGDDYDCGDCCSMGGLAAEEEHVHTWIYEVVGPRIKKLRDAVSENCDLQNVLTEQMRLKTEYADLMREAERKLALAEAENKELKRVLRKHEWDDESGIGDDAWCLACSKHKPHHAPDCWLAALLSQTEKRK